MREVVRHEPGTTFVTRYDDDGNVVESAAYSTVTFPPYANVQSFKAANVQSFKANRHARRRAAARARRAR